MASKTADSSSFEVFAGEELGHTKLLSGSVPAELKVTKLTAVVPT